MSYEVAASGNLGLVNRTIEDAVEELARLEEEEFDLTAVRRDVDSRLLAVTERCGEAKACIEMLSTVRHALEEQEAARGE